MSATQTHFRVTVGAAFRGLDAPQRHPKTNAAGYKAAAEARRQLDEAMRDVMTCQPASLGACLDKLHAVRHLTEAVLGLLPEDQRERTPRQIAHPLTVADHLEAAAVTSRAHRPPTWYEPQAERLDAIEAKLESLAALICRLGASLKDGGAR
jgi:hypothetical protein